MNYAKIAKMIITRSLALKKGDQFFLEVTGVENFNLGVAVKNLAEKRKIKTIFREQTYTESEEMWNSLTEQSLDSKIAVDSSIMKQSNAYCSISGESPYTLCEEKRKFRDKYFVEVHEKIRLNKPWVLTQVPSKKMASWLKCDVKTLLAMYQKSCCYNFKRIKKSIEFLKKLMENTSKVRIVAPETDLTFSIKDQKTIPCTGEFNLPDGEIFTSPLKESVNGTIKYNVASRKNGIVHKNIKLKFVNGKIVKATSNHTKELEEVFNTDEGARYVGEFSLGFNKYLTSPMGSILYDEKIAGSLHFTPGACYDEAPNGNKSALHWDLVLIQTSEMGGGQIYFDDILLRDNGKFIHKKLKALN